MGEMGVEERTVIEVTFGCYQPHLFNIPLCVDEHGIQNSDSFILSLASPKPGVEVCSQNMTI